MKKLLLFASATMVVAILTQCKTTKEPGTGGNTAKAIVDEAPAKIIIKEPVISYAKDIAPFIKLSCAPCHFAPDGKKEPLDTYNALKENITTVVRHIKLPVEDPNYMPFKSKKPAISAENIAKLELWVKGGMKE
jgi:hypothetical protein